MDYTERHPRGSSLMKAMCFVVVERDTIEICCIEACNGKLIDKPERNDED